MIIDDTRIAVLNERPERTGSYVLYWMQQSGRAECNHALEYAVQQANAIGLPLLVAFGLTDRYPDANLRHYRFMLEGLVEVRDALARRGIPFRLRYGAPDDVALELGRDAAMIITDRGYLRHQKKWRRRVADEAECPVHQIESDVVVPVDVASNKAEYAARTIRPKIHRHLDAFLVDLRTTALENSDMNIAPESIDLDYIDGVLDGLDIDRTVGPVSEHFTGGTSRARMHLKRLLENCFDEYDATRNQPSASNVSHLSKYLHFGQISPLWVALQVIDARGPGDVNRESFIEELIVRRELAMNFVNFTENYDSYSAMPAWARKTLAKHRNDKRPVVYTRSQLESAETHDPYWNDAMNQMKQTGYMHNYLRMYWGKKIIEWTNTPEHAYRVALELNNRYLLDGRDANSYTGVGWLFGLHDRPWAEREVFGMVRYMNRKR